MSANDGDAEKQAGMRLMVALGGFALLIFVLGIVGIYAISYGF